jgi:hypothetical protein
VRRAFTPGNKGYRLFARDYAPQQDAETMRKAKDRWSVRVPMRVRAMVLAGDTLFIAGPPDVVPDEDPAGAFEGRKGADLWALSAATGATLRKIQRLEAPPVYDGLIAAEASLYLSTKDGRVHCFATR